MTFPLPLPKRGKRNILITSALPDLHNLPHIGNIVECVLSGDVFARYCRNRGYIVLYVCGTDDYHSMNDDYHSMSEGFITKATDEGSSIKTTPIDDYISPLQLTEMYHDIHKDIYDWFGIDFSMFGRTITPLHINTCESVFEKLLDNGWLDKHTIQQPYRHYKYQVDLYSKRGCKRGGEQCKKCLNFVNPTELVDAECKACLAAPLTQDTTHFSLNLSALKDKLVEVSSNSSNITGRVTSCCLKAELQNKRCITLNCQWGTPLLLDGFDFEGKVFDSWFDAPLGYVSITMCHIAEWEQWWLNPDNVELYQFIGKEHVPFHIVTFPFTLFGTGDNWTMVKTLSVAENLYYESGEFSKKKGVGVFGNDVKDTNISVEVWRYYLLANRPEVSDALFTWADFQAKLNNELLGNLGNFIYQVLSFIANDIGSGYGFIIPNARVAYSHPQTKAFGQKVAKYVKQYIKFMEKVKLKQGLKIAMSISGAGNAYLQETKFWKLYNEDRASCSIVMKTAVGVVHLLACLLEPFMPSFSFEVLKQLNLPETRISLSDGDVERAERPWEILSAGHKIGTPAPLFQEMKDKEVDFYRMKFAGSLADRDAH